MKVTLDDIEQVTRKLAEIYDGHVSIGLDTRLYQHYKPSRFESEWSLYIERDWENKIRTFKTWKLLLAWFDSITNPEPDELELEEIDAGL